MYNLYKTTAQIVAITDYSRPLHTFFCGAVNLQRASSFNLRRAAAISLLKTGVSYAIILLQ